MVTGGWLPVFVVDVPVDDPWLEVAETEDDADTETLAAEAVSPRRQIEVRMNMYFIGFSSLCVQSYDATNRTNIYKVNINLQ